MQDRPARLHHALDNEKGSNGSQRPGTRSRTGPGTTRGDTSAQSAAGTYGAGPTGCQTRSAPGPPTRCPTVCSGSGATAGRSRFTSCAGFRTGGSRTETKRSRRGFRPSPRAQAGHSRTGPIHDSRTR